MEYTTDEITNMKINLNIFQKWITGTDPSIAYENFIKFSDEYQIDLYDALNAYYNNVDIVTDDMMYFFKIVIYEYIKNSPKTSEFSSSITFSHDDKKTNLGLIKTKCIFQCTVGSTVLCYFKHNGNIFYIN